MRKTKNFAIGLLTVALLLGCASPTSQQEATTIEPSKLDVESFINGIDTQQDISELSLSDCRILRNGFAARVGYPFRDAYLRGIFQTTTWYDSLQWVFWEDPRYIKEVEPIENEPWRDEFYRSVKDDAIKYTDEEKAFMEKLKEREEELMKHNFDVPEGLRVNLPNLLNPHQLVDFPTELQQKLAENGFAIVPAEHQQLFHVYEQNDYSNMPNFVTTDLYLQLFHLYVDCLLRDVEQQKLYGMLSQFCQETQKALVGFDKDVDVQLRQWLVSCFTVANSLLTGTEPKDDPTALHEYQQVMKSEDNMSEFLGYTNAQFAYSLFRPRGHYTRNDSLQRYFRTMMWLQTVPFQTDNLADMTKMSILAEAIGKSPLLTKLYNDISEPLTWLMGRPDDVSIMQAWQIMQESPNDLTTAYRRINEMAEQQTRLRPKFQHTSRNKVRIMPQRYQPDAEVLQEMVDYDSKKTLRPVPEGLDVMAAMGVGAAEQLLIEEGQKWKGFEPMMKKMKARMDSIDWNETIATRWLSALKTVNETSEKAPYFMLTPEWDKKELNCALASWAELKHDAILYAKQPMGAECGGGGPPEPVVKGYVEPNVGFWQKAIDLLNATQQLLDRYDLTTRKAKNATNSLREQAEFLLRLSEKEMKGETFTDSEYDHLKIIGAMFENISLDLIREPNQYLMGWDDVQGPDRNTALVADVYTANADNNPEKSILYAAVGQADEIYVVVEIGGYLYLTRGAVLSYREFTRPIDQQRLNDEEWQNYLKEHPREGVPQWMNPITVPLKKNPVPNEKFFYSTGC